MAARITIPSGSTVTVGQYVKAWDKLRHMSHNELEKDVPARQWQWYPVHASEALRDMRAAMHDRINRRAPLAIADGDIDLMGDRRPQWRKLSSDWQRATASLARQVNARRVVRVHDIPKEFRARLAHRIHHDD